MFDRSTRAQGPLLVEIALAGGRLLEGKLVVQQGRTLPEVLNGPTTFIELEMPAQRTFVAKSSILTVTLLEHAAARAPDLERPENLSVACSATGTDASAAAQ